MSAFGFEFKLCSTIRTCILRQQDVVTLSSTEAEYISMCKDIKKILSMRPFVSSLVQSRKIATIAMVLKVDNQEGIYLALNASNNRRTCHFIIRYLLTREALAAKQVKMEYCLNQNKLADISKKALEPTKFDVFV